MFRHRSRPIPAILATCAMNSVLMTVPPIIELKSGADISYGISGAGCSSPSARESDSALRPNGSAHLFSCAKTISPYPCTGRRLKQVTSSPFNTLHRSNPAQVASDDWLGRTATRAINSRAARTKRFLGVSTVNSSNRQATKPRASSWRRSVERTSILPRTRFSAAVLFL